MNFNTLVNTKGIKGSRRGGDAKTMAAKAMSVTKDVSVKAAASIAGVMPATNNKVHALEYGSLTRDRELLHEISKNRVAIDELRAALGMAPIPVSTTEEVVESVMRMEAADTIRMEETRADAPVFSNVFAKLQEALMGTKAPKAEVVQEAVQEAYEEVVEEMPVVQPVSTAGPSRRFVSSPEASSYDYHNVSEQA